jgi:type I restriction enzyme R subunit
LIDKKNYSEQEIRSKFITPALQASGWDLLSQIGEERHITAGRIIVRGKMVSRGKNKRADYVLFIKPNIPIAIVEAKDNKHAVGDGTRLLKALLHEALVPTVEALEAAE